VLVLAVCWRTATVSAPPAQLHRLVAAYVRLPGGAPALAWPGEGQAAVEVQGVAGAVVGTAGQAPAPIASVAKVMTAYLTLLAHPLGPGEQGFVLRIGRAQVREQQQRVALDESTVPVRAGERLTERQALEALLLPSANNIAALLAEHEGGTRAFVARMNATARALGMRSTTYTDPSGFADTTVSTAFDQLRLARAAMRLPSFAALVDQPAVRLPVAGRVANFNALVGQDGYVGVKTGSDSAAGGCLMFAKRAVAAGRRLLVLGVVLGQRAGALVGAALASAQRLGDSAVAALRVLTALPAGTLVLGASDSDGRRTDGATARPLRALGWPGLRLRLRISPMPLGNSLRAGARLAEVTLEGSPPASGAAVASRALPGPSLGWRLRHLL
jgi:D-alanyl-D-alanine carboxypeptidase (penicillin-binding protein 5/6)